MFGGVSAEEVKLNINVEVVEFNLQSLFGDFISQIGSHGIVCLFTELNDKLFHLKIFVNVLKF